ncbi:uncharacterized protein LOC101845400 isoform X2 [Aplysia californica]|uniref:Uncharacterized protein LOC101845400 isoform X2 n=1 Tax=Aplysia californica TaxID=6500 RepID=A0ABM1VTG7_APLCA|nr:uncharacterized protein LOC101845400 isoform X2 [Aplysia californica]
MDLMFFSFLSTAVCVLVVVAFKLNKYLSLLRWINGNAYVLSKKRDHFSILEVLDLFKNVRPFPISNQKGWKIDSYAHGHRIWFNFLTFPHNINAPSIKVFAAFDRIGASSQALLQVLKDISQSCDWKPGVISTSHTHNLKSHEVPSSSRGLPSMPVQVDCIKEERLVPLEPKFSLRYHDPWVTENVIPTTSVEFKRFWHREDNGVSWLLQMNEKLQTCEFYLIQPVSDVEQCLLSVLTWSQTPSQASKERASILLSSLGEYMSVRRLQKTPLLSITLPQDLSESDTESSDSSQRHESFSRDKPLFNSFKKFILDRRSTSNSSDDGRLSNSNFRRAQLERSSSILKYKSQNSTANSKGANGVGSASGEPAKQSGAFNPLCTSENKDSTDGAVRKQSLLHRSVSDGSALKQSRQLDRQLQEDQQDEDDDGEESVRQGEEEEGKRDREGEGEAASQMENEANVSEEDIQVAHHKTLSNQCAAELLAEAVRASNIDLELSSDKQAESSGGWFYIGKGFVLAPPKTVWDAVKNPRTRFTYDDTLKKVDILESVNSTLKIVYFYHESQQFLMKSSCDMCVLQGERQEGDKYILTYSSIEHDKSPPQPGTLRARFHPSGWIIEPARQDNKVYSIVTYLMQVDFGSPQDNSDKFPFEDMISRYPLSIVDLQQYLKPAMQMLRRKSLT